MIASPTKKASKSNGWQKLKFLWHLGGDSKTPAHLLRPEDEHGNASSYKMELIHLISDTSLTCSLLSIYEHCV